MHYDYNQACRPWVCQVCILADQLILFQPGGTDYAHLITTGTPGFSDLPTALGPDDSKVFNNLHTSLTVKFVVLNLVF